MGVGGSGPKEGQIDGEGGAMVLAKEHSTQNDCPVYRLHPVNSKWSRFHFNSGPVTFSDSGILKAMVYTYIDIYVLTNAKCRLYTVSGSVLELVSLKEH